ncbi:MAG TPA: hypothetical protein VFX76_02020 [Roseiflexaceae bacterium]|nr:hypothetical protein [Roseiflexaceae bacterium]
MLRERIVWIVALVLVAAGGFYTGRTLGITTGEQNRAQASQDFFGQRGGGQRGQGGGQAGQGGARGGGVAGTVNAIDGNTITVATRNGQTVKVQLAADGTVRKQVDGALSDVKSGDQIVAFGTQNGDVFQATGVQIGGLGGFGGPGGQGGQGGPRPTAAP